MVLECLISAEPAATHYWTRDSLPIAESTKYTTEQFDELDGRVTLRLNIRHLQPNDYGDYQCVAGNRLGKIHKTVTLYGLQTLFLLAIVTSAIVWHTLQHATF